MTKTILNKVLLVALTAVVASTFASCVYFSQSRLDSKVDSLRKDLPKELDNGMSADEIRYDKGRNIVSINYVWRPDTTGQEWLYYYYGTAAERKEKMLNLLSIKKINRELPELIEAAEAGIEVEVATDAGPSIVTVVYPNISTFNDAAKGKATDVNE